MTNTTGAPAKGAAYAALALALAGSCAFAQTRQTADEPTIQETELAPITVSAHDGIAIPYDQTGVSVSILDIPELKKEGIYTLSEALTTVPGVFAMPGGGSNQRGNVSNISIRGLGSSYVLPMIDGMRVSSLSGNNGNMTPNVIARTNLFDIGVAEALKGAEGAVYGGGATAGVIFMETPEGKGEPTFSLFNEAGSFDSYAGNFTAQGEIGKLGYFLSVTHDRTNNDIKLANGRTWPFKHAGRFDNWQEALRLDWHINEDNQLTLTYRRADSEYHYSSIYDDGSPYGPYITNADYKFRTNLATAKLRTRVNEKFSTSLMAGYSGADQSFGGGTDYNLRNVQIEWRNVYKWNEKNTTTGGFSWNRSFYRDLSGYNARRNPYNNLDNTYGFFAEHAYSPAKNWTGSFAARLDQSSNFDALVTARAATSYRFNKENTRAFASVGRGYRAPGSFQRSTGVYESYGSRFYGNPDLDCETNWSADLGIEQKIAGDHYASATLFWIRTEDAISSVTSYNPVTYASDTHYYNAGGHNTAQGIELALRGTLEKDWNTGYKVACTLTQPKTSDDRQIAYSARQVWTADIHTSPIEGLTTGIGLTAASGRSDYSANLPRLDAYYTLRWYAQYKANEHLTFHLRVENLTNQKFVTESGVPYEYSFINPGIAVYGGCTITF